MKITFFDKSSVVVDNDRAQRIIQAMNAGTEMIEIDGDYYKTASIASIKKSQDLSSVKMIGGAKYETNVDRTPTLELSEKQRLINLSNINLLRQQFYNRKPSAQ